VSLTVPLSLESLLRESAIDAELAALASMLVEARVPVIVAGEVDADTRARVLEAVLEALPGDARRIDLAGPTEDFAWLPEAESLGWRSDGPTPGREPVAPADAEHSVLLAGDLAPDELTATWAGVMRIAARAVSIGYGLAATIRAGSLEEVLARLRAAPFRLTEDELSRLGLVLVLGERPTSALPRVVAAHYLRPVARDMHGHVQKLGPAVLATWDDRNGRFEHFGWGVTPELAIRTGRHAGDFEIELDRRRDGFEQSAA
jgi:type IV secretory pathway ATPase VirB11/archaellum biosynthesis ATPase